MSFVREDGTLALGRDAERMGQVRIDQLLLPTSDDSIIRWSIPDASELCT